MISQENGSSVRQRAAELVKGLENGDHLWKGAALCSCHLSQEPGEHKPDLGQISRTLVELEEMIGREGSCLRRSGTQRSWQKSLKGPVAIDSLKKVAERRH